MRKHPAYWFSILTVSILSLAGCGGTDNTLPEVVIDRSECAKCRMLISDARFVGMIKTNEYLMFDDLGCMLKFDRTVSAQEKNGLWVRDYYANQWIDAGKAVFLRLDAVETPMGYGYIATAKQSEQATGQNVSARIEGFTALREDFTTRFAAKAQ
jgi:copper chaperone NosL